jgi:hypothetical protein
LGVGRCSKSIAFGDEGKDSIWKEERRGCSNWRKGKEALLRAITFINITQFWPRSFSKVTNEDKSEKDKTVEQIGKEGEEV